MNETLGKLTRITNLRSVWANEAQDFTTWLSKDENLAELGKSIGIDMHCEERESSVGSFSVDIFASENDTGRKIIIENQLEETNHDHLGKLITYASGKDAEVVIWIVKKARDEHRQAVEWLNRHIDETIGFFLIEIELWQIGESLKAPRFNIVERPNDWAKEMKSTNNDTERMRLEFWQEFTNVAQQDIRMINNLTIHSASKRNRYDWSFLGGDITMRLSVRQGAMTITLLIKDKDLFQHYRQIHLI